jgi:hypothetical protein
VLLNDVASDFRSAALKKGFASASWRMQSLLPCRKNKILESASRRMLRFYFCFGVEYDQNSEFIKAF